MFSFVFYFMLNVFLEYMVLLLNVFNLVLILGIWLILVLIIFFIIVFFLFCQFCGFLMLCLIFLVFKVFFVFFIFLLYLCELFQLVDKYVLWSGVVFFIKYIDRIWIKVGQWNGYVLKYYYFFGCWRIYVMFIFG